MASKSKNRRRVFRASCILAALIVAGSSFAWFTSSDEVTNRLSANADYDVAIAEDFTPPEKWLPGQTIEKNVGIVNTGNIDAFVRAWLEGQMNLVAQERDLAEAGTDGYDTTKKTSDLTEVEDENLKALGLNYSYSDGTDTVYLKELDKTIYANPNDPTAQKNNPAYFSEVMTVQAGGVLAYLETGANNDEKLFIYTPNNSNTFKSDKGATFEVDGKKVYTVKRDASTSVLAGDDIKVDGNDIIVKDEATAVKYLGEHIDSDNFYPAATGTFIFRRNADKTGLPSESDYEMSGYYYVKSGSETGKPVANDANEEFNPYTNQGVYFALQYVDSDTTDHRSDYTLEDTAFTYEDSDDDGIYEFTKGTVYLYTAKQNLIENKDLVWDYKDTVVVYNGKTYYKESSSWKDLDGTTVDSTSTLQTTLNGLTTASPAYVVREETGGKVKIVVQLANNIGAATSATDAEKWTKIAGGTDKSDMFYYNNDLEEGATTSRLVDSVTLDGTVTKEAFLAFDFDLNIFMDSMQVTPDTSGVETTVNVSPWAADAGNTDFATAASGTKGNVATDTEIEWIAWTTT